MLLLGLTPTLIGALILTGCGGTRRETGTGPVGCGGIVSGATFSVSYGERSRSNALSSALSGRFVITNGAPGGGNVTVNFNRSSTLAAHTETYNLPSVSTSATAGALTLYASADQTGATVGTASATLALTCNSVQLSSFSIAQTITSVTVAPATVTVGGPTLQLAFTAKDAHSNTVVVTPGSATFAGTGAAATVTKDGIVTPVSAGTITVTATVDGVASAPATITVSPAVTTGTAYKVVDLGVSALLQAYSIIGEGSMARRMNNAGKCVICNLSDNHYYVVDVAHPAARTLLAGSDNQTQVYAIGDAGDVLGVKLGSGAVYWSSPYTAFTPFETHVTGPYAINASGAAVSTGSLGPNYLSSLTAKPQTMSLLPDASFDILPRDINATGLIVGYASNSSKIPTTNTGIYYANSSAAPAILNVTAGITDYSATSCNDSGVIVGLYSTQYGPQGLLWPTSTSTPTAIGPFAPFGINNSGVVVGHSIDFGNPSGGTLAYVYTAKNGGKLLYDLCDSSRAGWKFTDAVAVNNQGMIFGQGTLGGNEHTFVAIPNP